MLLDRYILLRFLANFIMLFVALYLFVICIDLVLALDEFVKAAREVAGNDASALKVFAALVRLSLHFQAPRLFQFYAFLHGLGAIGAMGFTLAQMFRHRELLAILATGTSMQRIALPFIVGIFALSILQLLNQEFLLPRVAPLLLRSHGEIGMGSVESFPVPFTPDGPNRLLQSSSFNPRTQTLEAPTILERDPQGLTQRRITAARAGWRSREVDGAMLRGWALEDGVAVHVQPGAGAEGAGALTQAPIDYYVSDLSPRALIVRRHAQFAAMLSLRQIGQMLETPGITEEKMLLRYRYSRFAVVLVNVLVMGLTLPSFLLREPASLLMRSVMCAAIALPALLGAALFMMIDLPGIPPAVAVFLPVIILIPAVVGRWMFVRT